MPHLNPTAPGPDLTFNAPIIFTNAPTLASSSPSIYNIYLPKFYAPASCCLLSSEVLPPSCPVYLSPITSTTITYFVFIFSPDRSADCSTSRPTLSESSVSVSLLTVRTFRTPLSPCTAFHPVAVHDPSHLDTSHYPVSNTQHTFQARCRQNLRASPKGPRTGHELLVSEEGESRRYYPPPPYRVRDLGPARKKKVVTSSRVAEEGGAQRAAFVATHTRVEPT